MENSTFVKKIQPSLRFAGILGTIGGFVGDVLSPLGPILNYLLYLSIVILVISLILQLITPKQKREVFKMVSLSSLFFTIIFGVFVNLNEDSENGFLGDNVGLVSDFQASLNIIDVKLNELSGQIEEGFESVSTQINDLTNLIKNSDPINNPSSPKDYIINAYVFTDRGDFLKAQESFEAYFNLTNQYKVDVLLDYAKILESNEGYSSVKYFFENLKQNNNYGITVAEKIFTSNSKLDLANQLIKFQNDDLIFKWALLTLKVDTFFEISNAARSAEYGSPEYNLYMSLYYDTLNMSVKNHLELGCDFKILDKYFLNNNKSKELVFSNKMQNVPGYYNWFANPDNKLDFDTFNKLKDLGCFRN